MNSILSASTTNFDASAKHVVLLPQNSQLADVLAQLAHAANVPVQSLQSDFTGKYKERVTFYTSTGATVTLAGLGENPTAVQLKRLIRSLVHARKQKLSNSLAIHAQHLQGILSDEALVQALACGVSLATYDLGILKTTDKTPHPLADEQAQLTLHADWDNQEALEKTAQQAAQLADTTTRVLNLVDRPANHKTPTMLAQWAQDSGKKYGYDVSVLDKEVLGAEGLNLLLAVSQGSIEPPALIVAEYKHPQANGKTIGLVGKGVTFDTGGLSIKPSGNMHMMKSDMGGAAAVLGAIETAARWQMPVHIVAIVPTTENCVDAAAVKPGDVITSYSGRTVEIVDTDAEGRLILADALSYMLKHKKPDYLIDLATLTGSAVRALGYHAAALFTANPELEAALRKAGDETGERLWPMPLWDEYKDEVKSDIADVRNLSGKPVGGAISAAKFLEVFTENHTAWAHLDIAGVAFGDHEFATQKSATGFGIHLLLRWISSLH